jgi:hypothetical protein
MYGPLRNEIANLQVEAAIQDKLNVNQRIAVQINLNIREIIRSLGSDLTGSPGKRLLVKEGERIPLLR